MIGLYHLHVFTLHMITISKPEFRFLPEKNEKKNGRKRGKAGILPVHIINNFSFVSESAGIPVHEIRKL